MIVYAHGFLAGAASSSSGVDLAWPAARACGHHKMHMMVITEYETHRDKLLQRLSELEGEVVEHFQSHE